MPTLRASLLDLATKACADQSKVTAAQMKDLFKLVLAAVRQTRRYAEATVVEIWQPESWTTLKDTMVKSSKFASSVALHKMCDQVVHLTAKGDVRRKKVSSKRKRNAEEDEETVVEPAPKVKKSSRSKKAKVASS